MSTRKFLLTTPQGILALRDQQPEPCIQGPNGFVSLEGAFRDALSAHMLHEDLRILLEATRWALQEARAGKGKLTKDALSSLERATIRASAWR
jgi:hypothetical protein